MNQSLFNDNKLLSYVPAQQTINNGLSHEIIEPEQKNKLAVIAIILTGIAFFTSVLLVPAAAAIGISVAALLTAVKRKTSKTLSVVSLSLSSVIFVASAVIVGMLVLSYESEPVVRVPLNYTADTYNELAYKYLQNPQVPCDASGACVLEIDLLSTGGYCSAGGELSQPLFSTTTGYEVPAASTDIPALTVGEKATVSLSYQSVENDVLMFVTAPTISCL